jgi:hypothetical protein
MSVQALQIAEHRPAGCSRTRRIRGGPLALVLAGTAAAGQGAGAEHALSKAADPLAASSLSAALRVHRSEARAARLISPPPFSQC